MKIKTWRDPYEAGFSPTKPTEIELQPGLTVLVGCNGAGKSTLLRNIEEHCKINKISCHLYDNLKSGGFSSISSLMFEGDYGEASYLFCASEGEGIKANVQRESTMYKGFFENGYMNNSKNRMARIFADEDKLKELDLQYATCKDRVLLFDAVDSGLSVDSIVEVKKMFDSIIEDTKNMNLNIYIIIAANEYELARHSNCFDVNEGKYIAFNDYEEYRSFIIKNRIAKEKRIEKQISWRNNKKQKEIEKYIKYRKSIEQKRITLQNKKDSGKRLNWNEEYTLDHIDSVIRDFVRELRFVNEEELNKIWKETQE